MLRLILNFLIIKESQKASQIFYLIFFINNKSATNVV